MSPISIFILGMIAGGAVVWLFVRIARKHKFITSHATHTNKLENVGMSGGGEMPALIERQAKEKGEK